MSWPHPRSGVAVLCLALAASVVADCTLAAELPNVVPALPENVPRFLSEAAALSVADFAYGLAEVRVSAGFVVLASDSIESSLAHGARIRWHIRRAEDAKPVALEDVLDVFRNAHPDYEVLSLPGLLRVRARAIATASGLFTKRTPRVRIDTLPLPTAFNRAARVAEPSIPVADGSIASILSSPEDPPVAVSDPPRISVDLTQVTFPDVLDAIVRQAPGTVWLLSQHGKPPQATYYTLAVRIPNGMYTVFEDKLGGR